MKLNSKKEDKKDSTELINDLKKFKLAVENTSEHIIITDPEGNVIYGNHAAEIITGYSLKEMLGKKAGSLWGFPMSKDFYQNLWHTIKEEKKTFKGELKNRRKNGEAYEAFVSISPVLNDDNDVIFYVRLERDITKEKQIDRAKTEFVSFATHQLKTPIGAMNWNLEMLMKGSFGKLTEEQIEVTKEIYSLNKRMFDLVTSFLNMSRIELGTFIFNPTVVDFVSVCEKVIEEFKDKIIYKKHTIVKNYQNNKIEAIADPEMLRVIFQNLLSNAIKYTQDNGRITISIKIENDKINISFANNGIPIPEEEKPKIFDKMFRASNARNLDPEGNGLGLYLLKSVVENFGGKVWFKSKEEEDTIFFIEFPMPGMKKREGK